MRIGFRLEDLLPLEVLRIGFFQVRQPRNLEAEIGGTFDPLLVVQTAVDTDKDV